MMCLKKIRCKNVHCTWIRAVTPKHSCKYGSEASGSTEATDCLALLKDSVIFLLQDSSPLTQIMIKGKGKVPVHCTKASGGMEELFHSFLTSAVDADGW
jgi:hypothetical protein